MELKPFQKRAVQELFSGYYSDKQEIVIKSCTGSGKTIIMSSFIDEFLSKEDNTVFIWLTPGKGELEIQSKSKMSNYYPKNHTILVNDILLSGFNNGDIAYINWELVNKKDNNAFKDGDKSDLLDQIKVAKNEGLKFIIIIDESHSHDTIKSSVVINYFKPEKVIKMSATPNGYDDPYLIDIPENVVIQEELIKKRIVINEDINPNDVVENQINFLLQKSISKRDDINNQFKAIKANINPLVLVQIPNNSDDMLKDIENYFLKSNISYENGKLGVWLTNKKINIDNIEKNNNSTDFLIIKQAIATGWDCPRAHILVKLRGNTSEKFDIQTVGRIRRMPEAKHYYNDLVDSAYLYTVDMKFIEDVKTSVGNNAIEAKKIYLKDDYKNIVLTKELRSFQPLGSDPIIALNSMYGYLTNKYNFYSLDDYYKAMESYGYVFSETVIRSMHRGIVSTLDVKKMNELEKISIFEPLNTHLHGRDFHNILGDIGSKVGLPYDIIRLIIRRLFEKNVKPTNKKILKLDTKQLYAFIINNQNILTNDLYDAMSDVNMQHLNLMIDTKTYEKFKFPQENIFTYDSTSKVQKEYYKNVYQGYISSAEPRSLPEKEFEKYLQSNPSVDWFYKNGDKGLEFFSIVYRDNSGKQKLFYPDYILNVNDHTWIIETKGGFSRTGTSEDIDKFSPIKFKTLLEYGSKYQIKIGFVRKDKKSNELFIATHNFDDDISSENWKLLDAVFMEV